MILQVDHISKAFGDKQVLADVSFCVDRGQAMALLGGNGAGKTTLLRIITRLLQPDSGTLLFDGHPLGQADLSQVGYLPEERGLYRNMRVGEQALYLMQLKGLGRHDAKAALQPWLQRLGMEDWWQLPTRKLSKGMQQRLQFAVSVAHSPRLLILDEPFSGLDADGAALLRSQIELLLAQGTAIILSTHNLQAAADLCTKTLKLTTNH
ncbi:MAG: ATP-binding cassette domain-containing protein [Bacteroidales bacterium]|nr:ATP-binding cassette domain-containing protein [Bacteroidales bacterium]